MVVSDVWGYHLMYRKPSKAACFMMIMAQQNKARRRHYKKEFVFSFKRRIRFRNKKKLKKHYITRRLLYNYYLMIPRRHFKKMHRKASKQLGCYTGNYLALVEGRLFMIIFRANFVTNIFSLKTIIDRGLFMVNGKKRSYVNYIVKKGDFVTVRRFYRTMILYDLFLRIRARVIFWRVPNYLMICYRFMYIFFWRKPMSDKEIPYPVKIDVFVGATAYFL
jgi:small subunit ribosomal protein S4